MGRVAHWWSELRVPGYSLVDDRRRQHDAAAGNLCLDLQQQAPGAHALRPGPLPAPPQDGGAWARLVDTGLEAPEDAVLEAGPPLPPTGTYTLAAKAAVLLVSNPATTPAGGAAYAAGYSAGFTA